MQQSEEALRINFRSLSDEELQRRANSGSLSAEAQAVAADELAYRQKFPETRDSGSSVSRSGRNGRKISPWWWLFGAFVVFRIVYALLKPA